MITVAVGLPSGMCLGDQNWCLGEATFPACCPVSCASSLPGPPGGGPGGVRGGWSQERALQRSRACLPLLCQTVDVARRELYLSPGSVLPVVSGERALHLPRGLCDFWCLVSGWRAGLGEGRSSGLEGVGEGREAGLGSSSLKDKWKVRSERNVQAAVPVGHLLTSGAGAGAPCAHTGFAASVSRRAAFPCWLLGFSALNLAHIQPPLLPTSSGGQAKLPPWGTAPCPSVYSCSIWAPQSRAQGTPCVSPRRSPGHSVHSSASTSLGQELSARPDPSLGGCCQGCLHHLLPPCFWSCPQRWRRA